MTHEAKYLMAKSAGLTAREMLHNLEIQLEAYVTDFRLAMRSHKANDLDRIYEHGKAARELYAYVKERMYEEENELSTGSTMEN